MYLINTQTQIDWIISPTTNTIVSSNINIIIVNPNGDFSFVVNQTFIAPTDTVPGLVTHLITPNIKGLWDITLVKGNADTYTPLSQVTLSVLNGDTLINPISYSDNSLEII